MKIRYYDINKALNTIDNDDSIVRFIKVIHPISAVHVEMLERVASESYHMIEEYMDRLVAETVIVSEEELLGLLGLDENRSMAEIFLQELIEIEHIRVEEGRLIATDLARKSLNDHLKYENNLTKRIIYFEATTLSPLPANYYDNSGRFFTESNRDIYGGYVFDEGDYIFDDAKLSNLARMSGQQRLKYNIPQELINIKFDINAKEGFKSLFTKYYFAVFENGSYAAYDVDTLEKSEFFNMFLSNNLEWIKRLLNVLDINNKINTIAPVIKPGSADEKMVSYSNIRFIKGIYECQVTDELIEIIDKNVAMEDGRGLLNKLLKNLLNYKKVSICDKNIVANYGKIIGIKVDERQKKWLQSIVNRELNKKNRYREEWKDNSTSRI